MNTQNTQNTNIGHNVTLRDREHMSVSGVCEVVSFDEGGVLLDTVMGTMAVDGTELRITRLDLDRKEVDICGKVCGIVYAEKRAKKGSFRRG